MRVFAVATILMLSSSSIPAFAQEAGKAAGSNQPQTVQPERTPPQSEQSRERDRQRAEDIQVGRDWRVQQRDGDRSGRMRRDDDDRGFYDEDRPRRRVKICFEYENGDEYCRYRN